MLFCPLLVMSGTTKSLSFAISSLFNYNKYLLSDRGLYSALLGTTGWKKVAGWGALKWKGVQTFFWAPQLTSISSSRPWRWREERSNLWEILADVWLPSYWKRSDWCIWLSFKTCFLSSWPKTGGFADQFSWLKNLRITLVFEIKEKKTNTCSSRIWIPPYLALEDTWLIPAALLRPLLLHSCQDPEHF